MGFNTRGSKVHPKSIDEIRKITTDVRSLIGLQPGWVDVHFILESTFTTYIPRFEYDIKEFEFLGNDLARTHPLIPRIEVRDDVYDKLCMGNGMARFTIAHEFGHLFLHRSPILQMGDGIHERYEDSEWQANTFAAEFLMPIEECKHLKTAADISKKFGVSIPAATHRLNRVLFEKRLGKL